MLKRILMNTNSTMVLDFEKNIVEIEAKIEGLKLLAKDEDVDIAHEVNRLQQKLEKQVKQSYANLTPWQKSQVARHPDRPHCLDYVHALIEDFTPLCGDRAFADDEAMIGGIGRFKNISVVVLGQEKGHDLETRMKHNFGMAKPEGYRKAQRLMDMADKFNMPVLAFVDTAGAYPGVEAEAAVRPKPLPQQFRSACAFACLWFRLSSAKAVPAALLPLPPPTGF